MGQGVGREQQEEEVETAGEVAGLQTYVCLCCFAIQSFEVLVFGL